MSELIALLCVFMLYCVHNNNIIHKGVIMRTNIEIDDELMKDVLKATGLKTKKDVVELGLKTLIRLRKQKRIKDFRGQLKWTGDLDDMRTV